jgi:hypothetical protein
MGSFVKKLKEENYSFSDMVCTQKKAGWNMDGKILI